MSWTDLITHVLATTSKVNKVIVYDAKGGPVAATEGVETSIAEGLALVLCLQDPTKLLVNLDIDGDCFCCIQGEDQNMVGRGVRDHTLVIAAVKEPEGEHSVVFIGRSAGKGSFIFELQNCLALRAQGRLLPQIQKQQEDQQPPSSFASDDLMGASIIEGVEQVLVEIA